MAGKLCSTILKGRIRRTTLWSVRVPTRAAAGRVASHPWFTPKSSGVALSGGSAVILAICPFRNAMGSETSGEVARRGEEGAG